MASEPSNPREVGKRTSKLLKPVIFAIRLLTSNLRIRIRVWS